MLSNSNTFERSRSRQNENSGEVVELRSNTTGIPVSRIGKVHIVGAGPGDPELITVKAVRLLQEADVIYYDRLIGSELLDYTRPDARKISVGKKASRPSVSQNDINNKLISEAMKGYQVVRLKGGDPFIFGRGGEECLALSRVDVPFEVVPGISSVSAVPAYAGIPLTMRNQATGFTVISGHLHPDSQSYDWYALSATSTLVILMGLRNLCDILEKLLEHGKSTCEPIAIIRWGTTREQQVVTGTIADIRQNSTHITPPATIIIGEVVKYHHELSWFTPEAEPGNGHEIRSTGISKNIAAAL